MWFQFSDKHLKLTSKYSQASKQNYKFFMRTFERERTVLGLWSVGQPVVSITERNIITASVSQSSHVFLLMTLHEPN